MNTKINNNYNTDVSMGRIPYQTPLTKFGRGITDDTPTSVTTTSTVAKPLYIYPDYAERGVAVKLTLVSKNAADTGQVITVYGLDVHGKKQEENITSAGLTGVVTQYEYLRLFRMKIITGPINVGDIDLRSADLSEIHASIDFDADGNGQGQTEMAVYTVAAGHHLMIDGVDASTYETDKCNVILTKRNMAITTAPFLTKYNWMLYRNILQKTFPIPDTTMELTDIEMRSYNVSGVGAISSMFYGVEHQLNSVPIDLTNYSVTGGDGQIVVSWDEQTPAETSDMKGFIVTYNDGNNTYSYFISDKDATGTTITGLTNGTEYTVTAVWVGYDDVKNDEHRSAVSSGTATPGVTAAQYVVSQGFDPLGATGSTDTAYFLSDDEGATWTTETIGSVGEDVNTVAVNDTFGLAATDDGTTKYLYETVDGSAWSLVPGIVPLIVSKLGDLIFRVSFGVVESSFDNVTWNTCTGITSMTNYGALLGTTYYTGNETIASKSTDGIAFTAMTNQPTTPDNMAASATTLLAYNVDTATTVTYEYAAGDVAWGSGTSTITATSLGGVAVVFYDGLFHTTAYEADLSAAYYETSPDGITWTDASSNIPATYLAAGIGTDGTTLYIGLATAGLQGAIMTYDGTTYGTPVITGTPTLIPGAISGTA